MVYRLLPILATGIVPALLPIAPPRWAKHCQSLLLLAYWLNRAAKIN
jgi:hypothetical protein